MFSTYTSFSFDWCNQTPEQAQHVRTNWQSAHFVLLRSSATFLAWRPRCKATRQTASLLTLFLDVRLVCIVPSLVILMCPTLLALSFLISRVMSRIKVVSLIPRVQRSEIRLFALLCWRWLYTLVYIFAVCSSATFAYLKGCNTIGGHSIVASSWYQVGAYQPLLLSVLSVVISITSHTVWRTEAGEQLWLSVIMYNIWHLS